MKLILFSLGAVSLLFTQVLGGEFTIDLKSRTFDPEPGFLVDDILNQPGAPTSGLIHFFLQFTQIPNFAERNAIEGLGFEFLDSIGGPGSVGVYIVAADVNDLPSVSGLPNARWAGPILASDKVAPSLSGPVSEISWAVVDETSGPGIAVEGSTSLVVNIQFFSTASEQDKQDIISGCGGMVLAEITPISIFTVSLPVGSESCIAENDAVEYMTPIEPPLGDTNDQARVAANVLPLAGPLYNLDGTGVTILVYDSGTVDTHPDYNARVLQRDAGDNVRSHSTHVCGTCCGDGANSNGVDTAGNTNPGTPDQWQGMAPGVDIRSFGHTGTDFYNILGDVQADFTTAMTTGNGIDLSTMSQGQNVVPNMLACNLLGDYSQMSNLIDRIVTGLINNGQQLIFIQSAGNERGGGAACGNFRTIGSPATSKNGLAVGAINSDDNSMTLFSSWGPTDDGRVKPDIVAPGCTTVGNPLFGNLAGLVSTDFLDLPNAQMGNGDLDAGETQNAYTTKCGTSMATPVVSGSVALLIQQWQTLNGPGTRPLPHTVKAIMIHTANDLGNTVPRYDFGWGALDARAAVDLVIADDTDDLIHIANSDQGDVDTYTFNSCGTEDVRVTLVWDDPAANAMANPTLQNDLDLRLTTPAGVILQPLVLDPTNAATQAMPAVPGNDAVNNVEMIIAPGECGLWQVTVTGTQVPAGPQEYTLITPADEPGGPPDLTCPADTTVACGGDSTSASTGFATGMATCGALVVITESDTGSLCDGLITRTWTATDNCDQATCDQEIRPDYNVNPVVVCPADATIECIEDDSPTNTGIATAANECGTVDVTSSDGLLNGGACGGSFTRTWTATNECDNTDACDQEITVNDTTPPEITCPADVQVKKCGDDIASATLGTATATDNCDAGVTITESDTSDTSDKLKCPKTITRTWTATDECGNASTCEQVITYKSNPPANSVVCFSGENSVEVQGKGITYIDSLKIGDWVRVSGDNKYAQVYSLSHWNKDQQADFFQITAKSTAAETTIEATADHLLYALNGSALKTIPASDVQVGDLMVTEDGTPAHVIRIDTVKRNGIFAPFTTTGDIVVSGLVASNYAAIYNEKKVRFPISFHWMAHAYKGIHRMACSVNFDWCNNEAYTADGISKWNPQWLTQWYAWFGQQGTGVQTIIMTLMLPTLFVVSILEKIFQSAIIWSILMSGFAFAIAKKRAKVWKVKSV